MYDAIIIGAGVAGLTAAIYGQRRAMNILVLSKDIGGQVNLTTEIENYPGFENISAYELIDRMSNQVKNLGVEIKTTEVQKITKLGEQNFTVQTTSGEYRAKSIVVAMGLLPRSLKLPSEQKFAGKGISYCANCDGPFFKNKKIAVVGGGNSALDAAEYLSKIGTEVHLIHRSETFRAFDEIVKLVQSIPNITIHTDSQIVDITGTDKVEAVKIINNKTQEEKTIAVDGVFIEIGRVASTNFLEGLIDRDDNNQIIINENCATNLPGVFAAGDVTTTPVKQITVACGLGTIAILSAYQYLHQGTDANLLADHGKKNK